jgi:outer membrane protein assembly factor BamB
MRHGEIRRGSLLYVVVTAVRPRYCGLAAVVAAAILVVGALTLDAQGPRRPRRPPPKPSTLLLPAEPAWTVVLPAAQAAPAVAADRVAVVPLATGELHAFDWETGDLRWVFAFATTIAPAFAANVVVAANDRVIEAIDAATGTSKWRHPVSSPPSMLAGTASALYFLDAMGITALDVATGSELWSSSTDGRPGQLAAGPRGVAVTQADERVMLFALADGRRRWVRQLSGILRAPAWAGETLVVPSSERTVWALDAGDGGVKWEWTLGGAAVGVAGDADRVYIVGLDNVLRGVNRGNGHQRWQQSLGTRAQLAPINLDGAVLVPGLSPPLTLFNSQTGMSIGTQVATAGLVGPPLVDRVVRPGRVAIVMALHDGRLIGLRSIGLQFHELGLMPLTALPGRTVPRERLP